MNHNNNFCLVAPPSFSVRPQDKKVGLNGIAMFECLAKGNPPPSVFWTKEGSQMLMFPDNSYGHIHITSQGTLQIRGVQKEDAGYFVCSALSVAGSATTRAFLQVPFAYMIITSPSLNMHCEKSWLKLKMRSLKEF